MKIADVNSTNFGFFLGVRLAFTSAPDAENKDDGGGGRNGDADVCRNLLFSRAFSAVLAGNFRAAFVAAAFVSATGTFLEPANREGPMTSSSLPAEPISPKSLHTLSSSAAPTSMSMSLSVAAGGAAATALFFVLEFEAAAAGRHQYSTRQHK